MINKKDYTRKIIPTIEFIETNSFFSTSFIEHKEKKTITKIKGKKENRNSLSHRLYQYINTILVNKFLPNGDHNA